MARKGTLAPGLNFKKIQFDLVNLGSNSPTIQTEQRACVREKPRDGFPNFILTSGFPLNGQQKFELGLKLA
jgi:hypothetical protein